MSSDVAEPLEEMENLTYEEAQEEEEEEDNISPTDLSELLKEGTKEAHDRAENTQFVKEFLKGRIKRELFKLGTVALYFTYSALEEEMERNKEHPAFAPLYFPAELHRAPALEQDLAFFYGEGWQGAVRCSEATRRYVERIRQVGRHRPELLAAHAYTRYMGDLSGGQVLRKVAQRALGLPASGEGLRFYAFDNVSSAQGFKQLYRARLNALDLDPETKEEVVKEANRAFEFNMQVFEELDKIGALLTEETQDGGLPVHDGKGDVRKCPFYAAKPDGAGPPCGCPLALLQQPSAQAAMAVCVALLAVALAAWYLM